MLDHPKQKSQPNANNSLENHMRWRTIKNIHKTEQQKTAAESKIQEMFHPIPSHEHFSKY